MWATKRLNEYIVKGFTMNDELLKQAGGGKYFDEVSAIERHFIAELESVKNKLNP
jgi:hypothetical protein